MTHGLKCDCHLCEAERTAIALFLLLLGLGEMLLGLFVLRFAR